MSHIAIPHLAAVSLVPRRQSVMEGVLTRARDKPPEQKCRRHPAQGFTP